MSTLQAHLLVASPELPEPFTRSVVLLIRHNEDGALGLILNRRTTALLKDTWARLSEVPCNREEAIFLGGPCEGPLVALHAQLSLAEHEVMPGLYFSAGKEKLEVLAEQQDTLPIKFFAGYSGWSAGQLEAEIARGSWLVIPATPAHVFEHENELWARASRAAADQSLRSALQIRHAPADLRAN